MNMLYRPVSFLKSCLFLALALCLSEPLLSSEGLPINLEASQFLDASGKPYAEIYYSLQRGNLGIAESDEGYSYQVVANLRIFKDDDLYVSEAWKIADTMADTSNTAGKQIIDLVRYYLDGPAEYRIELHCKDLNRHVIDSVSTTLTARSLQGETINVSDVELASIARRKSTASTKMFVKGGYEIVPNPTLVFGETTPALFYYFESYNLNRHLAGGKYRCLAYLKDAAGNEIEGLGRGHRTRRCSTDQGVEMGMLNVSNLASGQYLFSYGLADTAGNSFVLQDKRIYIYNPSVAVANTVQAGSGQEYMAELEPMSSKQLDDEYARMIYLVSKQDRAFYEQLTNVRAKRRYIAKVWNSKIGTEGLTGAMYRRAYLERADVAVQKWREPGKAGWQTDRGRVFILYGSPTQIDRYPNTPENKPYEVWEFDHLQGQGGVKFVFADRYGFNKYELLHSDLRGELQDPNWKQYVMMGLSGGHQRTPF